MRTYSVYLAGPITGISYGNATDWRHWFADALPTSIEAFNPLRGKDYLRHEVEIKAEYKNVALSCARGITTRDYYDVRRADLVVVNLLGASKVSIGTVMEIAWAKAFQIPVILIIEEKDNVHDHPMIQESVGFRVNTLEEAIWLTKVILLPKPLGFPPDTVVVKKDFFTRQDYNKDHTHPGC